MVAIVLVNWNGYAYTAKCLDSLRKISYQDFGVIVVDNASTDDSVEQLRAHYPEIVLLENSSNAGFTGGNNLALNHVLNTAKYDYVMLLNNDTEVTEGFLEPLITSLDSSTEIGAVQPKMRYVHDRSLIWNAGGKYNPWLGLPQTVGENQKDVGQFDEARAVDWITGCCILMRVETLRSLGLLEEQYFAYFEDVDWSFRLKAMGKKLLYEPKSLIYHEAGVSGKRKEKGKEGYLSPFVIQLNVRNHLYFYRKHVKGLYKISAGFYQAGKVLAYALYFLLRGRKEKLKAVLKGLQEGLS